MADVTTHLSQVQRLNLPVVLEMAHPARREPCFVALLRLAGDEALVSADLAELAVSLSEIERYWTKRALFPWPTASPLATAASPNERQAVARAALVRLGYDASDPARALLRFQNETDLVPDGTIGPRTLLALYALSERNRPALVRGLP